MRYFWGSVYILKKSVELFQYKSQYQVLLLSLSKSRIRPKMILWTQIQSAGSVKCKWLVRLANWFVKKGKRTKHTEFSYSVTKFISSNAQGSRDWFVERISHMMTIDQKGISVRFVRGEIFEHAQKFPTDEAEITGQRADSPDKKQI